MSRDMIKHAVRLWRSDMAPRSVRRHNARQWLRSVHALGDSWLLAKPIEKPDTRSGT